MSSVLDTCLMSCYFMKLWWKIRDMFLPTWTLKLSKTEKWPCNCIWGILFWPSAMGHLQRGCESGVQEDKKEVRLTEEPLKSVLKDDMVCDPSKSFSGSSDFCLHPSISLVFLLTKWRWKLTLSLEWGQGTGLRASCPQGKFSEGSCGILASNHMQFNCMFSVFVCLSSFEIVGNFLWKHRDEEIRIL